MNPILLSLAGWSSNAKWEGLTHGVTLWSSRKRVDELALRESRYFNDQTSQKAPHD